MNFIVEAIKNLKPGATWSLNGDTYNGLDWLDETQSKPTEEEIQTEIERLRAEHERTQYQRLRLKEYPSIQDQLDVLYHQGYDGWKASIDEVKNKYPKPGEDL